MNLTAAGTAMMTNKYQYNAVDNILGITNTVDPTRGNTNGDKKLGSAFKHSYAYDDLNRLVYANGKAKQASYSMQMTFGRMNEPLTKVQKVDSTKTAQSYDFMYKYEDSNHPTAPTQIGHEHYTYDANGNPTLVENDSLETERRMYWDEDTSSEEMPYKFNGKELDQETGQYYYGARYMNPVTNLWYGVDALTEKYPTIGGYVYCVGNLIKFVGSAPRAAQSSAKDSSSVSDVGCASSTVR